MYGAATVTTSADVIPGREIINPLITNSGVITRYVMKLPIPTPAEVCNGISSASKKINMSSDIPAAVPGTILCSAGVKSIAGILSTTTAISNIRPIKIADTILAFLSIFPKPIISATAVPTG